MPHLEEGEIHAWLDGAADEGEAARIEAHVASCEQCAAEVATARGLIAGASRILMSLDSVPAGVIPRQDMKRPLSRHSAWLSRPWVRIAASLMLVAGVGVVATRDQRSADDRVTIEFKTAAVGADSAASSGPAAETPPMSTAVSASAEAERREATAQDVASLGAVSASSGPASSGRAAQRDLSTAKLAVPGSEFATRPTAPPAAPPPAPQPASPPPPMVADASRLEATSLAGAAGDLVQRRVAQDSLAARSRLSEIVVTGTASGAQSAAAATAPTANQLQLRAPGAGSNGLGGACFSLDARSPAGSAGIPLLPTRLRIQLANAPATPVPNAPTVAQESRLRRSEVNAADVQAGGGASRQAAAPAPRAYAAPTSEPAEPLTWRPAPGDSVVAYWGTATDVVVFRLHVSGEQVTGNAAAQTAPDRPSTIEGRRVPCGGG